MTFANFARFEIITTVVTGRQRNVEKESVVNEQWTIRFHFALSMC